MTVEKNQNLNLLDNSSLSPEQLKQKEQLQFRILDLKEVANDVQSKTQDLKNEILTDIVLLNLEKKVHILDGRNAEKFLADVERIEAELVVLEGVRRSLGDLKSKVVVGNSQLLTQMNEQLPNHDLRANQQRVVSYEAIANIRPQVWENPIANRLAGWIQDILA